MTDKYRDVIDILDPRMKDCVHLLKGTQEDVLEVKTNTPGILKDFDTKEDYLNEINQIKVNMEEKISFTLNGKKTEITTDPNQTLLWVLRNQLGLTGTKYGCGTGFCGACTVLINREPSDRASTPCKRYCRKGSHYD